MVYLDLMHLHFMMLHLQALLVFGVYYICYLVHVHSTMQGAIPVCKTVAATR